MSAPNTSAPIVSAPTKPAPVVSAPVVAAPNTPAPIVATQIVSVPTMSGEWENGLCSNICGGDFGTCCAAWCCSSYLYGRAAQRLDNYPVSSPSKISTFDKHCLSFELAAVVGLVCLPVAFKRQEMRKRFDIQGDLCEDVAASMFCTPCTLAQMNSEMKDRAVKEQLTKPMGYPPQTQRMVYQPPNQQPQLQQTTPQQAAPQQPQVQEKAHLQQGV